MAIDNHAIGPGEGPQQGDPSAAPSFEQALARLEQVAHELEDGKIGLADGLACYEEGIQLLRQCYQLLQNAERRIELLRNVSVAGEATTEPFDVGGAEIEEKSVQPSRRRARKPAAAAPPEASESDPPGSLF